MKIKLAILDSDQSYLERIVSAFGRKYADKFEIYSFTDETIALQTIDTARVEVFVASDSFDIDVKALPKRCGFAYLVNSPDVEAIKEQTAICKFQKADLIYKQILSVYAEKADEISSFKMTEDGTKIVLFTGIGGGTGASTMAAAAAMYYASQGKKTLYVNLEPFGGADSFFSGEGQFTISDIIFALKSKKGNLPLKLESCVKQDHCGVYYYAQSPIALDMMELGDEELVRLVSELRITGGYDYIVLDAHFRFDNNAFKLYRQTNAIVWVSDGTEIANNKMLRAHTALATYEENADSPLISRICVVYNKFSNKTSKTLDDTVIRSIGGAPRYEHASVAQILQQLKTMNMFDKIV